MRKEYIMTDEDKVLKKKKIEQNRAKKRSPIDEPRITKMKREIIEESSYDDTSLSVASTVSDTGFIDLDVLRQSTLENMSPISAASVPSPSSPPENRDIIGSKSSDMLKDSTDNSSSKLIEFHDNLPREISSNLPLFESKKCEQSPSSSKSEVKINFTGQNSREIRINSAELVSKLIENPDFVVKLMSNNPNLLTKVLQDKNILTKIIRDPQVTATLAKEPQIIDFFQKNNSQKQSNRIRDMLEEKQSTVDNPILTNLIASDRTVVSDENEKELSQTNEYNESFKDNTANVFQRKPNTANSIESILCEAIKLEFSAYSWTGGNQNSRELNDAERAKLNELIVANKALLAPLDDDLTNLVGDECRFKVNKIYFFLFLQLINY